jgi:MFS family permease
MGGHKLMTLLFTVFFTGGIVGSIWLSHIFPRFGRRVRKSVGPWSDDFNHIYKRHIYLRDALTTIGFSIIIPAIFLLGRGHPYTLPLVIAGLMFAAPAAILADWVDRRHRSHPS